MKTHYAFAMIFIAGLSACSAGKSTDNANSTPVVPIVSKDKDGSVTNSPSQPLLHEPIKDQFTGKVLYVDYHKAESLCKVLGQRLPTPEELAKYAQSRGASGVVTQEYYNEDEIKPKIYLPDGTRADGRHSQMIQWVPFDDMDKTLTFYYFFEGFKHPSDEDGHQLWSSGGAKNVYMSNPASFYLLPLLLTEYGSIEMQDWHWQAAVRCVDKN